MQKYFLTIEMKMNFFCGEDAIDSRRDDSTHYILFLCEYCSILHLLGNSSDYMCLFFGLSLESVLTSYLSNE